MASADALQKEIDALLSDRPAADVLETLDDGGVPAGRIRSFPEDLDVFAGYAPARGGR